MVHSTETRLLHGILPNVFRHENPPTRCQVPRRYEALAAHHNASVGALVNAVADRDGESISASTPRKERTFLLRGGAARGPVATWNGTCSMPPQGRPQEAPEAALGQQERTRYEHAGFQPSQRCGPAAALAGSVLASGEAVRGRCRRSGEMPGRDAAPDDRHGRFLAPGRWDARADSEGGDRPWILNISRIAAYTDSLSPAIDIRHPLWSPRQLWQP